MSDMNHDYYPGSKRSRRQYEPGEVKQEETQVLELPGGKPYLVNNKTVKLYPLGALASALNRQPVTIRKMEQEGIIPRAPMILPSHDSRGQRRLYTLEHINGLREIADEEGILYPNGNGKWKSIETTKFKEKAVSLFRELS